jgi:hypothetical protein
MYSNDIYAGLKVYGVEMARALIEREIRGVFNAYNIRIDGRHLELIADYMVRFWRIRDKLWAESFLSDIRGRLQAIQSQRNLDKLLASAQSVL